MPPIRQLVDEYEHAVASKDDRTAAEAAYALAIRMMDSGNYDGAHRYANACIDAIERLPSSTMDDVASTRPSVGGVVMPDYFHDGVVRSRLGGLLDR